MELKIFGIHQIFNSIHPRCPAYNYIDSIHIGGLCWSPRGAKL